MISMNKTFTPELAPEVLLRLRDYAERFQDLFRYPTQFAWSGVYLRGLLEDGERKSIEPMAARVPRPPELLDIKDPEQALQQFVNQIRDEKLLPGDVVITDAGYGVSQPFRAGLEQRQLFYIAGVTSEMVVFTEEPRWIWPEPSTRGRPPSNPHLSDDSPRPVSLKLL